MASVWLVLGRELLDAWRDRRTWTVAFVLPFLMTPLIMFVITWVVTKDLQQPGPPRIFIENPEAAPHLANALRQTDGIEWVFDGDAASHLRLVFGEDAEEALTSEGVATLTIKYSSTKRSSVVALSTVKELLHQISYETGRQNLLRMDLSPTLLPTFRTVLEDQSDRIALGALLMSVMLPMMLALAASVGGLSMAIDTTAGEKERGTFEILLTCPLPRWTIITGKYLAVWIAAVLSLTSTTASIYVGVVINRLVAGEGGLQFSLPFSSAVWLLAAGTVLAALFAGLQVAISAMARNYKEAQVFVTPLALIPMLASMGGMAVESGQAPWFLYQIPIFNTTLIIKDLFLHSINLGHLLSAIGTTGLVAAVTIFWATHSLQKESVLFRV